MTEPTAPDSLNVWQQMLSRKIRVPDQETRADARLNCYRELCFHNLESFLANTFPICKKILGISLWTAQIDDFFAGTALKTPYFSEIPEYFIDYLNSAEDLLQKFPFFLELAHYEWVEMALTLSQEELPPPIDGEPTTTPLALSPLAWPLIYQFPVHQINRNFTPTKPLSEPVCLLVYRDRNDRTHFDVISLMTYRLLVWLEQNPAKTLDQTLAAIAPGLHLTNQQRLELVQILLDKPALVYSRQPFIELPTETN